MEIWKQIDEFPNYSVSNYGRVRNDQTKHIMIGGSDRDGYRQVTLSASSKQWNRRVCRLVAKAFLPNPDDLPEVNHKDENKSNDTVGNLEWCTTKYNLNYGSRQAKVRKPVRCIEMDRVFEGVRVAARFFGVSHSSIGHSCLTGHACHGLHFEFV